MGESPMPRPLSVAFIAAFILCTQLVEAAETTFSSAETSTFLGLAFLGGLVLNVMPCVIPVVLPKLLHLVRQANSQTDPRTRRHLLFTNSLAYTAGVLTAMLALGGLVGSLKLFGNEVGWGFHFQNRGFLGFMILLLTLLGLGMLEVFPLKSSTHDQDLRNLRSLRRRGDLRESLMTGLLVTVLGTPCTAPMLGTAMGFALTQSVTVILLFFGAVGLGLASPFLVLGLWTGWASRLTFRVSERYAHLTRVTGFFFLGTALWLLGVVLEAHGAPLAEALLWLALGIGLAAWLQGALTDNASSLRRRLTIAAPSTALLVLFGWWLLHDLPVPNAAAKPIDASTISWLDFSLLDMDKVRRGPRPIFLDFTAAWCMNCRFNERTVLETEATAAILAQHNYLAIKADFTQQNDTIFMWLKRFGRSGVPLYLVIPPCAEDNKVLVLPELLTASSLHEALHKGAASGSCTEQSAAGQ